MKLLFLSPNSEIGGAEAVLIEDMLALQAHHDIHVILPAEGTISKKLKGTKIIVHIVRFDWWIATHSLTFIQKIKFTRGYIISTLKIKKIITNISPDTLITNTIATPVAAIAAALASVKHIWYIHELGKEDHHLSFFFGEKKSYYLINKLSNRIITTSFLVQKKVAGYIPDNKIETIYCSVEIPNSEQFISAENPYKIALNSPLKLLITGRVGEGKRQEDAVKALEILIKKYDIPAQLTIVGDRGGEYSQQIKDYIQQNQLSAFVDFVQFTDNIYKYYQEADFVFICSRCEAFGRVTIEAMKLKKVVFASDAGANPELLGNNERGILYQMGDAEDLAQKVAQTMQHPIQLQQISQRAFEWSWQVCNTKTHLDNLLKTIQNA
ncbi:Glycosyltransferase involved in cell wall bisynthesis [Flexibacter flexilis DSM 6793]|uniref:Glycosyltransferase involved in cell wall bisynthesis n=1 Tax=Flexibacter flexilis DSM 6793 TaxID=927664 RepID=A0A1I1FXI9_9BACT|nr:glycosyltransferase [Flexibacter flexilis]SFC04289.1 Glycosyltransferase involved in cell wall bisynthesis [Flexibacter flexilis DSM 6793]